MLVRAEDGTLSSLHPRTGAVRWQRARRGSPATLPAVIDEDRALVAGPRPRRRRAARTGRVLWTEAQRRRGHGTARARRRRAARGRGGRHPALPRPRHAAPRAGRVSTREALLAPPLVDARRGRAYLGTTDKRILEVYARRRRRRLALDGRRRRRAAGPAARRTASSSHPTTPCSTHCAAAGNLAWRSSLPSRPLSGPLVAGGYVLVACLENELVVLDPADGQTRRLLPDRPRDPHAAARRRRICCVIGLRDRSVVAYAPARSRRGCRRRPRLLPRQPAR